MRRAKGEKGKEKRLLIIYVGGGQVRREREREEREREKKAPLEMLAIDDETFFFRALRGFISCAITYTYKVMNSSGLL